MLAPPKPIKRRDWLGFTYGHVRSMLFVVAIQAAFTILGTGMLALEIGVGLPGKLNANDRQLFWVSCVTNALTLLCCGLAFWGIPARMAIGKAGVVVLMLMLALSTVFAGIAIPLAGILCAFPQVIMLFFLVRGFMSVDLKQHYRSRY